MMATVKLKHNCHHSFSSSLMILILWFLWAPVMYRYVPCEKFVLVWQQLPVGAFFNDIQNEQRANWPRRASSGVGSLACCLGRWDLWHAAGLSCWDTCVWMSTGQLFPEERPVCYNRSALVTKHSTWWWWMKKNTVCVNNVCLWSTSLTKPTQPKFKYSDVGSPWQKLFCDTLKQTCYSSCCAVWLENWNRFAGK